jgi:1-acyl-sn-glycerol-3-phosphate acyltransferase
LSLEAAVADAVVVPLRPDEPDDAARADAAAGVSDSDAAAQGNLGGATEGEGRDRLTALLDLAARRISGDYEVDAFGLDPDLSDAALLPPFRWLYRRWFRVEVSGLENVPDAGAAMVVGNHAGTIAIDSVMTSLALLDEHPAHRRLRVLGGDLVFRTPFLGQFARATGSTLACRADVDRLLAAGEVVGVWPEGYKGVGKRYSERYRLQRFGRGGFVAAALRAGAPIVPVAIVGSEEIYPLLGDLSPVARLFGLPYMPVTPTFPWLGPLGAIPLPSKWVMEFGAPIETASFGPEAADDPGLVLDLTDQVRETIQAALPRLLEQRGSVFG